MPFVIHFMPALRHGLPSSVCSRFASRIAGAPALRCCFTTDDFIINLAFTEIHARKGADGMCNVYFIGQALASYDRSRGPPFLSAGVPVA